MHFTLGTNGRQKRLGVLPYENLRGTIIVIRAPESRHRSALPRRGQWKIELS